MADAVDGRVEAGILGGFGREQVALAWSAQLAGADAQ
jgi:hypothetical protein